MLKKDLNRGEGNRLAPGASLLGEGNSPADHAHASKATPLDTKRKEIAGDPQYEAINTAREKRTTRLRRDKEVKPV